MQGLTLQQIQQMGGKPVQPPVQSSGGLTAEQLNQMGAKPVDTTNTQPQAPQSLTDRVENVIDSVTGMPITSAVKAGVENIKNVAGDIMNRGQKLNTDLQQGRQTVEESGNNPTVRGAVTGQIAGNVAGQVAGAVGDMFSEPIKQVQDKISNIKAVQDVANNPAIGQALDSVNSSLGNVYGYVNDKTNIIPPNVKESIGNLVNAVMLMGGAKAEPVVGDLAQTGKETILNTADNAINTVGETRNALGELIPKSINPDQASAVAGLASDYEKWTGATKPGVKSLNKAEARTLALDNSGTTGRLPQQVLADSGIIPETTGTKFTTDAQANTYHEKIRDLMETADKAVDEISTYTPPVKLSELQAEAETRIKNLGLTVGEEKSMLNDIQSEFAGLQERYGGDEINLAQLKDEKSAYQRPVKFDATRPFKTDFNYQIGKTFQTTIEKEANKAGFPHVAQLNREVGDRLAAEQMLRKLDGQTLKYGKLGKYAMGIAGSALSTTIPGKILGYMGGEMVADLLMKADVANPLKRMILQGIKEKSPEAYLETLKFLEDRGVARAGQLALPEGKTITSPIKVNDASGIDKAGTQAMTDKYNQQLADQRPKLPAGNPNMVSGETVRLQAPASMEGQAKQIGTFKNPQAGFISTGKSNPLIEEAKKYKSAEKFVKKNNPVEYSFDSYSNPLDRWGEPMKYIRVDLFSKRTSKRERYNKKYNVRCIKRGIFKGI